MGNPTRERLVQGVTRARVLDGTDAAILAGFASIYGAFHVALAHAYALLDEDVALEMLAAAPLLHGGLPYVDAISHRGPWLSVVYAAGLSLGGSPFAVQAVHFVSACVFVLGATVLYGGVKSAHGRSTAVVMLTTLLAISTCVVATADSWTLNADALMAAWIAMSLGVLLLDGSPASTAGAGVLCALGFLTKQNGFPFLLAPMPYLLWARDHRQAAAWACGVAVPGALVLSCYAAAGHLPELWYGFYEYNAGYATVGGTRTLAERAYVFYWIFRSWGFLSAVPLVGLAIERRARDGLALSFLAAGVLAAAAPSRSWDNYLWAAHFPFALVFAAGLGTSVRALRTPSPRFAAAVTAFVMAAWSAAQSAHTALEMPAFLASRPAMSVGSGKPPRLGTRPEHVATIQQWSEPGDAIYVNAYAPELYVLAERRPASRHLTSNFVERFYPGSVVPTVLDEARAGELFEDLERSRPSVIVDACVLGYVAPPESAIHDLLYEYIRAKYRPVAPGIFVRDDSAARAVAWSGSSATCATAANSPEPR